MIYILTCDCWNIKKKITKWAVIIPPTYRRPNDHGTIIILKNNAKKPALQIRLFEIQKITTA